MLAHVSYFDYNASFLIVLINLLSWLCV